MLSHGLAFASDLERLREVIRRINRSPYGCGALAGKPFGIDRDAMAAELGFEGLLWNSMGVVADHDFVVERMQWGSMLMTHVGRWAEDLIIYSSGEFGFVRLADSYSAGSSLMPQEKNPDSLELLRGKSGRDFRPMAGLMMTVKGLSSTGTSVDELTYEKLREVDLRFERDIAEAFDYERSVKMRSAKASNSETSVREQSRIRKAMLG